MGFRITCTCNKDVLREPFAIEQRFVCLFVPRRPNWPVGRESRLVVRLAGVTENLFAEVVIRSAGIYRGAGRIREFRFLRASRSDQRAFLFASRVSRLPEERVLCALLLDLRSFPEPSTSECSTRRGSDQASCEFVMHIGFPPKVGRATHWLRMMPWRS